MSRPMIHRATAEFATSGRTLEGLAYYFDRPSSVTDNGGRTRYTEAFGRSSATKSINERGTFPLLYFHSLMEGSVGSRSRWAGEPFGAVTFAAGAEGLMFRTTLSKTQGADEMLELINDGAVGDVSIGAYPIKTSKRNGVDAYRDEIALVELSLAPVGTAQHEGAKVLAVRANQVDNVARLRALKLKGMH